MVYITNAGRTNQWTFVDRKTELDRKLKTSNGDQWYDRFVMLMKRFLSGWLRQKKWKNYVRLMLIWLRNTSGRYRC